jgi:pimeloyl-ACP methyl ester carboxylesterase
MAFLNFSSKDRLYYREFGKGKDVVLIPSLWVTSTSYAPLGEELGKHFHVIIPDLFRGKSKYSDSPKNHEDYVDELQRFIRAMNIKDYFLIGVSLSGITALKYILRSSPLPKKLFLVNSSMVPIVEPFDMTRQRRILIKGYFDLLLGNLKSLKGIRSNTRWVTDWIVNAVRHPTGAFREGLIGLSIRVPDISSVPIPSKLFFAKHDEFIPFDAVSRMKQIGNLAVEVIDGSHGWFFGREGELAAEINEYFSEGKKAS